MASTKQVLNIEIESYPALIKKRLSDDLITIWFTGYVRLSPPLLDKYPDESYRAGNIIGVDTSDKTDSPEEIQIEEIKNKIKNIISTHNEHN